MRVILVPVADRPECARALAAAFQLGERLGASVSGCHMRPHRYSDKSLSPAFAQAAWRRKSTSKAPEAARSLYRKVAEQHGYELVKRARQAPGALWSEKVGAPDVLMGIVGPVSDLVVVSRPMKAGGVADMFLNAALLESASPVLVVPQKLRKRIGRRVVIGWNQSADAAKAVTAAIPLLAEADEVTIVTCGPEERPGPKATQLVAYLRHWGISANREQTRGRRVEPELMDAYQACNGDLLIAGAYSRSRWRERVFGGTTEFLLHKARIPVLTLHA